MLPLSYVDDAKKPTAKPASAKAGSKKYADVPSHCATHPVGVSQYHPLLDLSTPLTATAMLYDAPNSPVF